MTKPQQFLLDTNILLAYIRAGKLGQHVERTYNLQALPFQPLICTVSIGELKAIADSSGWKQDKLARMAELLGKLVAVEISEPEVLNAYVIAVNRRPKGVTIPQNDLWIAAAAIATGSCLLTCDRHFDYLAEQKLIQREYIDPKAGKSNEP